MPVLANMMEGGMHLEERCAWRKASMSNCFSSGFLAAAAATRAAWLFSSDFVVVSAS